MHRRLKTARVFPVQKKLLLFTRRCVAFIIVCAIVFSDIGSYIYVPFVPEVPTAEAASSPAIRVESFDQNVSADGSTFTLTNDVGATSSAFIRMNTGTRKTSAGPTGSTANAGPNIGTVGLVLSDTATVTVKRANATEVKVMGEVWRYEGSVGGGNEFIVRDRVEVSLSGASVSTPISGITDVDKVVPFVTGYTVNDSSVSNWEAATIAAHIDDVGNLVVSRNNSAAVATVYVDVVEFVGSEWKVCHGYSGSHDGVEETVTLNTDSDGQGGSTCDVTDWSTATIIEATMEGDSAETGLSDTLALVRPGAATTEVVFDLLQDTGAFNDGEAWIHVLQNDNLVVNRASDANITEGDGSYGTASWPSGATTTTDIDTLSLEWFTDTSGVGTAHMRGGLHARITEPSPTLYNDGDLVPNTDYDSTIEGNFEADVSFAGSPAGIIYEAGGTGTGSLVGYNDSGDFIIRAGNGGSTAPADAARIVITTSEYDFSGRTGTLYWNFYPDTESVALSFDEGSNNSIEYATSTTAASAWANWSGGDDGYVGNGSASIAGSEVTSVLNFNGTISEVRFTQTGGTDQYISHWIHRSGNTVGVEYGVVELAGLSSVTADVYVSATGTQITTTEALATDVHAGGTFVIKENTSSRSVTSITITESGTVDGANGLDNIKLFYDLDTTGADGYDCSSESFDGTEPQFGSTDTSGFSGANGVSSFSGSAVISTTQTMCVYAVYDVTSSVVDGETIELSIDNPSTDVGASGVPDIGPASNVAILDTTTIQNTELTQVHYHWREDDGSETGASSVDGIEDTPAGGFQAGAPRRLRIEVSAEGSAASPDVQYRLQYGEKAGTCAAVSTWTDVAEKGGAWDSFDSPNVSNEGNTSDIVEANGGVTNEENTLYGTGAQVDGGDKSGSIALAADEFVELEYTVVPTSAAVEGTTYCFRVVDEIPTATHAYRVPLTVQSSQVASTLTDFPVYVDLSTLGSHFFSNVRSDGGDIRVTTADGTTELSREVVSINTGGGTGELHFLAPSISASSNTTFYIYYGAIDELSYHASSTYGSANVWSNGYAAVYHLPESGATYFDSSLNGYHGVGEATDPTLTTGKLGSGQDFAANGRIDIGNGMNGSLITAGEYYISTWLNLDSSATDQSPVAQYVGAGDFLLWADAGGAGTGFCHYNGSYLPSDCQDLNNQSIGNWQYVVAYHTGTAAGVYLNGVETGLGPTINTFAVDATQRFAIGAQNGDSTARYFNGQIDEVRISTVNFGIDWSAAEFSNQNTPTTFYATSSYETMSDSSEVITYTAYPEGSITADIVVSALNSQVASLDQGTTAQYLGGTFVIERPGANRTLTDITFTESGTIDATNLTNPRLYYDLAADCSVQSYSGAESSVAGSAFTGANGSTTFSLLGITLNSTQSLCGYVVFDISTDAVNGETIEIGIQNPSTDVVVTSSSVGPSTNISPTGSSTVAGPILTQTHYHWRNDNGDETDAGATSATAGVEDLPLLDIGRNTTVRLRTQVSNESTVNSQPTTYRLEYGTKITTCENIAVWSQVGVGAAFATSASAFISDGNTTDIDNTGNGAMTEENTTFVGTGALRETSSESGAITLSSTEYTELEFTIAATDASGYDTDYCFRVTDSGTPLLGYSTYPELTTREKQDFFVQRGVTVVSGTSTNLIAGVDYAAPASSTLAFVRITDTNMTGAGNGTTGAQDTPNNFTAYIVDATDLQSGFTIARPDTAVLTTRVSWEIVEYVGLQGADNEIIVRDVGTITYGGSALFATGTAVSNVNDDNDIVVFITGQVNPDPGTNNYNTGISLSRWAADTNEPVFERGDADGVAAGVSYAVVEFTGLNWKVQRVAHQYTASGVTEIETMSAVSSLNSTFLHAQKISGDELFNLDEGGHQVWLSSIGNVSFQIQNGATNPADQTSVAWVIENMQTGNGAMTVYRSNGTIAATSTQPTSNMYSIGAIVNTSNASIFVNNNSTGAGNFHPRVQLGATIASSTDYELWKADEGQNQNFRTEIFEWPVAQLAFEQNYYRFYVDNDAVTPTDPWPAGITDLGENTSVTTTDEPLGEGERIRIRTTLHVNNALWPELTKSFKLQYGRRVITCNAISAWTDVGAVGSGAIWRGFDATPVDGTTIDGGSLRISVSDFGGTYEEENNSAVNPATADVGDDVEFDWIVEHNGAVQRSDYCFRMINSDDTPLAGYNNYPTVRTTGYTPVIADWRWYNDEINETPVDALAATNTAPVDIGNQELIKLRVVAQEVESATGENIKFGLQYSQYADFSDGGIFLVSTSTCSATSTWCYADGAGVDNALITQNVIGTADSCVSGVGDGCGTHNETLSAPSSLTHPSLSSMEFEFTLKQANARVNGVYYFRLYDMNTGEPLIPILTYPSLVTEGSQLNFNVSGLSSGTVSEGVTSDVATTPSGVAFGSVPFDTPYNAIYRLNINTNATQGYQMLMYTTEPMTNSYGEQIPSITGTNAAPTSWAIGCQSDQTACFGYHVGDDTLAGGSTRFAADDTYAALSTTPREVMHSSVPANDTSDIVYRMQITDQQPAGDYEAEIMYIAVPVF